MSKMQNKIAEIRQLFEAELEGNPNAPYHPIDIERVRTEDWQVRRYLLDAKGDVAEAYRNMCKTLEWKLSFGLHKMTENYFPTEFYDLYRLEKHGVDREGHAIFSESYKMQRHYNELETAFKQLVAVSAERMDRIAGEKGMCYLGNFTDTAITTLDVSLARYRVDVLQKHYPLLTRRFVLNNVPFLLKPLIKLIVSFMKPAIKSAVVYTNTSQLTEYIDPKYLHTDLEGLREERFYPQKTVPFRVCYARFGVKPAFVDYYYRYNQLPME